MKKFILLPLLLLLSISINYAQDWKQLYQQGESFEEIKATMTKRFEGKSTNKIRGGNNYSKAFKQYARWEYYWRHQLDKTGNFVSPQQVVDSWEEAQELERNNRSSAVSNWSYLGPDAIPTATAPTYAGMGRLNTIAFDPSNPNIVWVGAPNGGLWRRNLGSSGTGGTWEDKSNNFPVLGISDIAIASNGHIYIATGDADGQHCVSVGVRKSTDGGNTFADTGLMNAITDQATSQFQIHHLWIKPDNDNILVATTTKGIFRTTDAGGTWTMVDQYPANDIKMNAANNNILYVASENYIIESKDAGATWPSDPLTSISEGRKLEIAVTPNDPNVIYISSDNGMGAKSVDGGINWSPMTLPNGYDSQGGYDMALVVSPTNKDLVMLAGVSGWISTNGGTSWTQHLNGVWEDNSSPGKYVHSDHHLIKFAPNNSNILFSCHDGGVHRGNFFDLNANWTDLSAGLFITQFYGMGGFPGDANIIIAGAQDNDAVFYNGTTWKNINNNSDGTGGVIDHTNSNISYAKSQAGFVDRTDNAWVSTVGGLEIENNNIDAGGFVWPLEMDPMNSSTLYAGYGNIYKSTNKGEAWTQLTNHSDVDTKYSGISVAPSNSSVIYAVRAESDISVSTNGGSSWTTLTNPVSGGRIRDIEVSLTDPTKAYIVFSGYTENEKVYMTTDQGANWTNISTGLPNIPVHTIAEKATSGDLYVGTSLGVYQKAAAANTWTSFSSNLPKVIISDLDIHEATNTLRAATFGRGIWKTPLSTTANCEATITITDNPFSGSRSASQTIETSGTVEVTTTAALKAGTSITLNAGFHAKAGSTFSATIEACTPSVLTTEELATIARISDIEQINVLKSATKDIADIKVVPNPSKGLTNLTFNLGEAMEVSIHVYNSNGQLVDNLASNNQLDAGHHQFLFNGIYQQAGLYYIILKTNHDVFTRKMIIVE